jgi:hypothetical protein
MSNLFNEVKSSVVSTINKENVMKLKDRYSNPTVKDIKRYATYGVLTGVAGALFGSTAAVLTLVGSALYDADSKLEETNNK